MNFIAPPFGRSIRCKIIIYLFVILSVSISTALYGIWIYERDRLVEASHKEAMQAARTIEKALRVAMLVNDRQGIQASINEIGAIVEPPSRISIVSLDGKVAFSNKPSFASQTIDRNSEPSCTICHLQQNKTPAYNSILVNTADGPLLRNVIKIANQKECFQCHDPSTPNLGILLYDSRFDGLYDMLHTVAMRTVLTGLITFITIIVVMFLLINRLVHRPIQSLMAGFRQVGTGNFNYWVEVDREDEFAEMADSFNVMSRAIGRYVDEIKVKRQEISTLYVVVQQISKTIEWREIKKIVISLLSEVFQTKENILVIDNENQPGSCEVIWSNPDMERLSHAKYGPNSTTFPSPILSKQEYEEWSTEKYHSPRYAEGDSRAIIPLVYGNTAFGLVSVKKSGDQPFTGPEKKLIPALANHISISLANARLYYMAITDSLTGLHTKRYMNDKLKQLQRNMQEEEDGGTFGLIIMDLDHFKEINDTHGHQTGDQVLVQMADIIHDNIRYGDIPCRYGGEEFVIILTKTLNGLQTAKEIGERLRQATEDHEFICTGCPVIKRTISIGVACWPEHGEDIDSLIRRADEALYRAKEEGRNLVRTA